MILDPRLPQRIAIHQMLVELAYSLSVLNSFVKLWPLPNAG
jgi:hypothetical protein